MVQCVRCHCPLRVILICEEMPVGWICQKCNRVWQYDLKWENYIGWNPWTGSFDPEALIPYA